MWSENGKLTIGVLSDSSGKLPKFINWTSYSGNVNKSLLTNNNYKPILEKSELKFYVSH
jgi:hypothetical protein